MGRERFRAGLDVWQHGRACHRGCEILLRPSLAPCARGSTDPTRRQRCRDDHISGDRAAAMRQRVHSGAGKCSTRPPLGGRLSLTARVCGLLSAALQQGLGRRRSEASIRSGSDASASAVRLRPGYRREGRLLLQRPRRRYLWLHYYVCTAPPCSNSTLPAAHRWRSLLRLLSP